MKPAENTRNALIELQQLFSQLQDRFDILYCNLNESVPWEVTQGALDCVEFSLYKSARTEVVTGNRFFTLQGNSLTLFDLGKGVRVALSAGCYHYITIKPLPHSDSSQYMAHLRKLCSFLETGVDAGTGAIETLFTEIQNEYLMKKPYYKAKISLLLQDILLMALRGMNRSEAEPAKYQSSHHTQLVHTVIDYLNRNHTEKIRLEDTARLTGLSPRYIDTLFRQTTGATIIEYLTKIRVESTKKALVSGSRPITDIALESGFESSSYFCKVFKKHTGLSPSAYREGSRTW